MYWSRIALKAEGKDKIRRNYGACVLAGLILALFTGTGGVVYLNRWLERSELSEWFLAPGAVFFVVKVLVLGVLELGIYRFFVENRDYSAGIGKVLFGFQCGHYGNVVCIMFLRDLYIYLWTLLLIVPGIVKRYEYRMVPYILAEQPDISSSDAFGISREMMRGQKFDAFVMDLSFLGWWLGSVFTAGLLGIFWTVPYQAAANAELYGFLRNRWIEEHAGPGSRQ